MASEVIKAIGLLLQMVLGM